MFWILHVEIKTGKEVGRDSKLCDHVYIYTDVYTVYRDELMRWKNSSV